MLPLFMAVATAALGFGPPCMVASIRCSRLHAARSCPMIASANIQPLPDDDTPSEKNHSVIGDVLREVARRQLADVSSAQLGMLVNNGAIELGDVLVEIARRQLDDIDPLDVAEAQLDTLADSSIIDAKKMLDTLNEGFESMQNITSDAELAYIQASEDRLLAKCEEHISRGFGRIEEIRGKILQARRERRRGAAVGADEAGMSEWWVQTALSDLRAAAKAQAKARALARAAAAIERNNLAAAKRRDLAIQCGLLALAAVLPPFLWRWT